MTNLIPIDEFGLMERKGQAVVSSHYVADVFGKRHDDVINSITSSIHTLVESNNRTFSDINFISSTYKDQRGRKQKEFLLTKDGFSYIVMGFTGKKASKFKVAYINHFNQMEQFIKDLYETRADFPEFTDAIMNSHEIPKPFHYSNECDMINKIVFGMTASKFRELHNVEKGKSIRPYLTPEQIKLIKSLQRIDIGLIVAIPNFHERKQMLEKQLERLKIRIAS